LPPERELIETFAVSRPTLRMALRELSAMHVLTLTPGRNGGYRVAEFSPSTLGTSIGEFISLSVGAKSLSAYQLLQVRHALEVLSARVAAVERTDEDLAALEMAFPDPQTYRDSVTEARRQDLAFHRALAIASHNPLIVGFASAATIAFNQVPDTAREQILPQLLEHLDAVLDAVRRSDPEAAAEAMERHLRVDAVFGPSSARAAKDLEHV
jgi:GntR family transcriptional repressor for pyruvate dehydrogenase complex